MKTSHAPESGMSTKQRRAFKLAQRSARQVIRRRLKVLRLTRDAYLKLEAGDSAMARVAQDLHAMLRIAKAWARGEYRAVPWRVMVYIMAAIIYFVNPVDLIPDILGGLGLVDDAAVIAAVVKSVHAELQAFRSWERALAEPVEAAPAEPLSAAA